MQALQTSAARAAPAAAVAPRTMLVVRPRSAAARRQATPAPSSGRSLLVVRAVAGEDPGRPESARVGTM